MKYWPRNAQGAFDDFPRGEWTTLLSHARANDVHAGSRSPERTTLVPELEGDSTQPWLAGPSRRGEAAEASVKLGEAISS